MYFFSVHEQTDTFIDNTALSLYRVISPLQSKYNTAIHEWWPQFHCLGGGGIHTCARTNDEHAYAILILYGYKLPRVLQASSDILTYPLLYFDLIQLSISNGTRTPHDIYRQKARRSKTNIDICKISHSTKCELVVLSLFALHSTMTKIYVPIGNNQRRMLCI